MVYVGIDLHRNRSQIAVLDEEGAQLLSRRMVNDPAASTARSLQKRPARKRRAESLEQVVAAHRFGALTRLWSEIGSSHPPP